MRVLVVEDEGLIAMDLAATLRRAGCTVVGPARRVATRCATSPTTRPTWRSST
jgi:AmiR/NasT family two-component response regulator